MNINEKEIPLKATNNAAYNVVNGVTYFKLKSGFPGDITKNCGLLGEEIDKNFFFLRGNDIKDIKFDENRNLVITRVNDEYEPLIVNIPTEEVEPIEIEYLREGKAYTTTIVPKYDEETGKYLIGWQGYMEYVEPKGLNLFKLSFYEVRYSLKATIKSLGMLIEGKATKDDVAGPVGIAQVIGDVAKESSEYGPLVVLLNLSNIALLLSVNLGVLNLLPFPALDGGRLVFLLVEAVRGKPIPPEKEGMVHFAGFVALMVLMVFVLYNDIIRLFA